MSAFSTLACSIGRRRTVETVFHLKELCLFIRFYEKADNRGLLMETDSSSQLVLQNIFVLS